MNRIELLAIIDRLLEKTMLGKSKLNPLLLLVARALVSHVERPARIWRVCEVAREAACRSDEITRKRKALLDGTPLSRESTFHPGDDSWVCHAAFEAGVMEGRVVAVETVEPYAYNDCGYVVDVNILKVIPNLVDNPVRDWVLDLENLADTMAMEKTCPSDVPP
jgi:hypothetical protein